MLHEPVIIHELARSIYRKLTYMGIKCECYEGEYHYYVTALAGSYIYIVLYYDGKMELMIGNNVLKYHLSDIDSVENLLLDCIDVVNTTREIKLEREIPDVE